MGSGWQQGMSCIYLFWFCSVKHINTAPTTGSGSDVAQQAYVLSILCKNSAAAPSVAELQGCRLTAKKNKTQHASHQRTII